MKSHRPLNDWERRVILRLLSSPFPGRDALLAQLESVVAESIDEDGSVGLECSNAAKAQVKTRVPVEAEAIDNDGVVIHYLLHVIDGRISELEVYKDDSSRVLQHPEPEKLTVLIA